MSEQEQPKVIGAPEEIWLVHGDIASDANHADCYEVTWCEDQQFDADVRYFRADRFERQAAERAALREALAEAIDIRVALYRHSDIDGETDNLNNIEVAKLDTYAKKWLKLIDETGKPTALLTGE